MQWCFWLVCGVQSPWKACYSTSLAGQSVYRYHVFVSVCLGRGTLGGYTEIIVMYTREQITTNHLLVGFSF